jgi:hypothetical protein
VFCFCQIKFQLITAQQHNQNSNEMTFVLYHQLFNYTTTITWSLVASDDDDDDNNDDRGPPTLPPSLLFFFTLYGIQVFLF